MSSQGPLCGPAHPEVPGLPAQPGSGPHSPIEADPDALAWAVKTAVIDAYARVKATWGVPLDRRIESAAPARFARWAPPRCQQPGCKWGFLEVAEDGSRVAPCPSCRAARAGASPG